MAKHPTQLGVAGAHLAPSGAGTPALLTCLDDIATDLATIVAPVASVTGTVDGTYDAVERTMINAMVAIVSFWPGATTNPATLAGATYTAAEQGILDTLKADINALAASTISDTSAGTYTGAVQTMITNLKTAVNAIQVAKMAVATPATYTAATQKLLSSCVVRLNALEALVNKAIHS